ncbi:MAG: dihydropteroate synthase [Spirochaetota bacterium]
MNLFQNLEFGSVEETPPPPMLMGILNVSPDSFSDGGKWSDPDRAMSQARRMVADGATIIDIGGESTRPGSTAVEPETEWHRISPVLLRLRAWLNEENPRRLEQGRGKIWLSVDTYKSVVALRSLELGIDIINDVSGGRSDPEILNVTARQEGSVYVLTHNPFSRAGKLPHARQESVMYSDPVQDVAAELRRLYDHAQKAGCRNIIIDPGLGFGKDIPGNWQILANLDRFSEVFCGAESPLLESCPPILIGASNKRFLRFAQEQSQEQEGICATAGGGFERFLSANLAVCASAILGGARIIRSHETREHYRCLRSAWEIRRNRKTIRKTIREGNEKGDEIARQNFFS